MTGIKKSMLPFVVGGIALTAAAIVFIPPLVSNMSVKAYRAQSDTSDIDFSNMGPEILKKESNTHEEE